MKKASCPFLLTAVMLAISASLAFAGAVIDEKASPAPEPVPEDFPVHPITSPYWNEDASITTDIRPVFVYHAFSGDVLGGGRASVTALQVRIKLLKNLQFVAYKDGWVNIDTPGLNSNGWNNIAAGLKWAFYQNDAAQFHAAVGAGYEFASGERQVLQDADQVRFWLSVDKGFGKLHLGADVNYLLSCGNGDPLLGTSNMFTWHLHADYQLCKYFSPVIEINGYHVTNNDTGNSGIVTPFSGVDVANLGGNTREDVVTMGVGVEVRPWERLALRTAYEFPLTNSVEVYGHRWTVSAVIKF